MPGSSDTSRRMPAGLWAPSQISSGAVPRTSIRPGMRTASIGAGSTARPERELDRRVGHRPVLVLVCAGDRHLPHSTRLRHEPLPAGLADHDHSARRHDRDLLGRDRLAGLAQELGVLERDVRQHLHPRAGEHVRRVEAAAQAGLDDRPLDARRTRTPRTRRRSAPRTGSRRRRPPRARAAPPPRRPPGSISAPPIRMRSRNDVRCGERYAPVRCPRRSRSASA